MFQLINFIFYLIPATLMAQLKGQRSPLCQQLHEQVGQQFGNMYQYNNFIISINDIIKSFIETGEITSWS